MTDRASLESVAALGPRLAASVFIASHLPFDRCLDDASNVVRRPLGPADRTARIVWVARRHSVDREPGSGGLIRMTTFPPAPRRGIQAA